MTWKQLGPRTWVCGDFEIFAAGDGFAILYELSDDEEYLGSYRTLAIAQDAAQSLRRAA